MMQCYFIDSILSVNKKCIHLLRDSPQLFEFEYWWGERERNAPISWFQRWRTAVGQSDSPQWAARLCNPSKRWLKYTCDAEQVGCSTSGPPVVEQEGVDIINDTMLAREILFTAIVLMMSSCDPTQAVCQYGYTIRSCDDFKPRRVETGEANCFQRNPSGNPSGRPAGSAPSGTRFDQEGALAPSPDGHSNQPVLMTTFSPYRIWVESNRYRTGAVMKGKFWNRNWSHLIQFDLIWLLFDDYFMYLMIVLHIQHQLLFI